MKITKTKLRQIIKEELIKLIETESAHGIKTNIGGTVIHLLPDEANPEGRKVTAVKVTKDIILLKSGERIIPSRVDWPATRIANADQRR